MSTSKSLNGRLALVTGASRGIGRAVAKALAASGAHVIATARTTGALEELDDEIASAGGKATLLPLDLRKGDRIDQLGPTLFQRWGKLDIFVGAAGILGPLSPLGHVTADSWDAVMDVNVNANWRLTRTLGPLLQRSDGARVIFVSSGAASGKNAYWGPYAVSKGALETLARTYAAELVSTPARVNIINPGPVRTAMRAKAFPGEDPSTLPTPEDLAPLFVELVQPGLKASGETFAYRDWAASRKAATPAG